LLVPEILGGAVSSLEKRVTKVRTESPGSEHRSPGGDRL